jgi:hypothetical protein
LECSEPQLTPVPRSSQDQAAEVDKELARVSWLLEEAACATLDGCRRTSRDLAQVHFLTANDATTLLDDVAAYAAEPGPHTAGVPASGAETPFRETLYERMTGCGSARDWNYTVHPIAWAGEDGEPIEDVDGPFPLPVSVRFPLADLPIIRERLARAVQDPLREYRLTGCPVFTDDYEDFDLVDLLLDLCSGAIGASLPCPESCPGTACVTLSSVWNARAFLGLIDGVTVGHDDHSGRGPEAVGLDPGRAQTLYLRLVGDCPDEAEH